MEQKRNKILYFSKLKYYICLILSNLFPDVSSFQHINNNIFDLKKLLDIKIGSKVLSLMTYGLVVFLKFSTFFSTPVEKLFWNVKGF